jgi:hypothetical protein
LRNRVYVFYIEDADDEDNGSDMRDARSRIELPTPYRVGYFQTVPRDRRCQTRFEVEESRLRDLIAENSALLERGELSEITQKAYRDYEAAYKIIFDEYCGHRHQFQGIVLITARGNVCEDLPFLALTCRMILGEMWIMCFSTATRSTKAGSTHERGLAAIKYEARVLNFDYFPLFRFLQMLRRLQAEIHVHGTQVDIAELVDNPRQEATAETKFDKVKRLIEQHWLEDLPLWDCLTGLDEGEGWSRSDCPPSPIGMTAKRCFWEWMYCIRQVVALYRIEPKTWRDLSIAYLRRYKQIYVGQTEGKAWETFEEADIIEEIIDMLIDAIEFRFGCDGRWSGEEEHGDNGQQSDRYFHMKGWIVDELGHAVVHLVNQYCERVNKTLREELGSFYVQWEESEDQRVIPKDILL